MNIGVVYTVDVGDIPAQCDNIKTLKMYVVIDVKKLANFRSYYF
jgi:hypothetical protein